MELSEIPIYVYPIAFILIVILVAVVSLLVGKRKYNKMNGVAPVKKEKVSKPKGKKLKKSDAAAPIHVPETYRNDHKDELDSDEEYEKAVESLRAKPAGNPNSAVVAGPVIVVDEKKVNEEPIIEWKPPVEEKKEVTEIQPKAVPVAAAVPTPAAVPAPQESDWNDDDLELFEARAYSFDEETQSGYTAEFVADKPTAKEAPVEVADENIYAFRERKQVRDPSDDEGVQFLETEEAKPVSEPEPAVKEKKTSSKYAYFDSVMEKDKGSSGEWKPPEKKAETITSAPAAEKPSENKTKKAGMQYIELDLDEK